MRLVVLQIENSSQSDSFAHSLTLSLIFRLRLNHGLWHSFIGIATYFFICSKENLQSLSYQHQLAKNFDINGPKTNKVKPKLA
jgi:hypothetical protein